MSRRRSHLGRQVNDDSRRSLGGDVGAGREGDGVAALGQKPAGVHAQLSLAQRHKRGWRVGAAGLARKRDQRTAAGGRLA